MAGRRKTATAAAPGTTRTAYVVLRAIELDDASRKALGLENTLLTQLWAPVLNEKAEHGVDGQVRVFHAANKPQAIRQYTGAGADVIPGTWKAVPLSSWKGGETTRTKITDERLPLEEGW